MSDVNFQRFSPHLKIQYKCFTVFFLLLNVVWIQDGWAETFVRVGRGTSTVQGLDFVTLKKVKLTLRCHWFTSQND